MKRVYFVIVALFFGLTIVGCGGDAHSGHDHAHDHEDNLQLTAYNSDFEMYAKANPFVVGHAGTVLSHFSYLSDFKPLVKTILPESATTLPQAELRINFGWLIRWILLPT